MPSYNRYRKVIDKLMPKIQPPNGNPGTIYLDELESEFIAVGILPEDYHQYDGIPKKYMDMVAQERATMFKRAFDSWRRKLEGYELVCVPDRASKFQHRILLSFEPLKENTQDKMRDDHLKYVRAFQRRAKTISSTKTFTEEDAKELDERNNELVKFVEEKGKLLKSKYDKKRIQ